jgi:putative sterol carrier protein
MSAKFPSEEWLKVLQEKINSDEKHRQIAKDWEGDLLFIIEPDETVKDRLTFYLDLFHGTCRAAEYNPDTSTRPTPAFTLTSSYKNIVDVLNGKINPVTAMMTQKLKVNGNMGYLMRNVPVVLDFVRCAGEVTDEIL